jgi:ribokinase
MAEGEATVPAFNVKAVDTTGAGDVFNGFLGVSLAGLSRFLSSVPGTKREWDFTMAEVEWAVRRASAAAALSVMRLSAQDAAPTMAEVEQFLTA